MATAMKRVSELRLGDMIDLEGDRYADPDSANPAFECEYAVVDYIERETSDCILIGIEGGDNFGFPPDHLVKCDAAGDEK
jgi:hypothetical protein